MTKKFYLPGANKSRGKKLFHFHTLENEKRSPPFNIFTCENRLLLSDFSGQNKTRVTFYKGMTFKLKTLQFSGQIILPLCIQRRLYLQGKKSSLVVKEFVLFC